MQVFLLLAILGFLTSFVVHASTFFTDRLAMEHGVWLLHIGIFVVFIPAVVNQGRARAAAAAKESNKGKGFDDIAPYSPRWMNALTLACFVYALVNFAIFFFLIREGAPRTENGQYVLKQNSTLVRTLTADEFHRLNRYETRGFSGHWLLFYMASVTALYSGIRQRRVEAASKPPPPPVRAARPDGPVHYMLRPRPRLSPWAHQSVRVAIIMTGWIGGPLTFVVLFNWLRPGGQGTPIPPPFGCLLACPFFGSAILGALLPSHLFAKHVPARCPACNGRAYFHTTPVRGYRCADCGHVHALEPLAETSESAKGAKQTPAAASAGDKGERSAG